MFAKLAAIRESGYYIYGVVTGFRGSGFGWLLTTAVLKFLFDIHHLCTYAIFLDVHIYGESWSFLDSWW